MGRRGEGCVGVLIGGGGGGECSGKNKVCGCFDSGRGCVWVQWEGKDKGMWVS